MKKIFSLLCALYAGTACADQIIQLNVHRDAAALPNQKLIVRVNPSEGVPQELSIRGCGNFSDMWWFTDALNTSVWTITVRNETCTIPICQGKVQFPLPPRYSANPNVPGAPGEPGVPLGKGIFVGIKTLPNGQIICEIRREKTPWPANI